MFINNYYHQLIRSIRFGISDTKPTSIIPNDANCIVSFRAKTKQDIVKYFNDPDRLRLLKKYELTGNLFIWASIHKNLPMRNAFDMKISVHGLAYTGKGSLYQSIKDQITSLDDIQYHRLDWHPSEPGEFLSHSALHLHTSCNSLPRIPWAPTSLIDYIEFLAINYDYEQWKTWVIDSWSENQKVFGDRKITQDEFDIERMFDDHITLRTDEFNKLHSNNREMVCMHLMGLKEIYNHHHLVIPRDDNFDLYPFNARVSI